MSRRQRSAKKNVARARVAHAKRMRRRARGAGTTRAAAAAVVTLVGVASTSGHAARGAGSETPQGAAVRIAASLAMCSVPPGPSSRPTYLTAAGGTLFFTADDGTHGTELWRSNGTRSGTELVKDIYAGTGHGYDDGPKDLTAVGGRLFFTVDDGTHGTELWKSNGTRSGTVLVKDINPGTGDGYDDGPTYLAAVGGTLFFAADDGTHGTELWKSDGTEAGTVLVKDIDRARHGVAHPSSSFPSQLTAVDRTLFFIAGGRHGTELWKSNGRRDGTVLVKTVNPGGVTSDYDYDPTQLTAVAGKLYFSDQDTHGTELWTSNGTKAGTVLVRDIYPGTPDGEYGGNYPYSANPSYLTAVGSTLFFTADERTHGGELWRSNGTRTGTVLVKDIKPGHDAGLPTSLTVAGGRLFFTARDGVHGQELWRSNGTRSGTVLVRDIRSGDDSSSPSSLTAAGGTLFFTAEDSVHGQELWKSSGTSSSTVLVKDIRPCAGQDGRPSSLTRVGRTLFFAGHDGVHGEELWTSNGTRSGTVLVKDINTGGS